MCFHSNLLGEYNQLMYQKGMVGQWKLKYVDNMYNMAPWQ